MKKLLVVTGLVLSSIMSYGQYSQYKSSMLKKYYNKLETNRANYTNITEGVDMNLFYGTNKTIGFEMNVLRGDNISIGGGMVLPVSKEAKGAYYKTLSPNKFPRDIYEKESGVGVALYGILGYTFNKILITGKLGVYTKENYFNAYDKTGILSSSGYYYTSTDGGMSGFIGTSISYKVGRVSPYVGFDNLSGTSLGIVYSFMD